MISKILKTQYVCVSHVSEGEKIFMCLWVWKRLTCIIFKMNKKSFHFLNEFLYIHIFKFALSECECSCFPVFFTHSTNCSFNSSFFFAVQYKFQLTLATIRNKFQRVIFKIKLLGDLSWWYHFLDSLMNLLISR